MLSVALLIALTAMLLLVGVLLLFWQRQRAVTDEIDWRARILDDSSQRELSGGSIVPPQAQQDPILRWLYTHLQRAGLEVESGLLRSLLLGIGGLVLLAGLIGGFVTALVTLGVVLLLSYGWLLRREYQRQARILAQLPEFLEHMGRALSAGNSIEESLYGATAEAEEPIRSLFLSVGRQVRLGAPIEDVLDEAARIHGINDLRIMALAARVNRRYGGSLKRIFKSLVQAIRERDAAARELRALTAETRFSAVVLGIVPLALSGYILLQNPQYYIDMWNLDTGRTLLLASVMLQITGIVVIWRMLRTAETSG